MSMSMSTSMLVPIPEYVQGPGAHQSVCLPPEHAAAVHVQRDFWQAAADEETNHHTTHARIVVVDT